MDEAQHYQVASTSARVLLIDTSPKLDLRILEVDEGLCQRPGHVHFDVVGTRDRAAASDLCAASSTTAHDRYLSDLEAESQRNDGVAGFVVGDTFIHGDLPSCAPGPPRTQAATISKSRRHGLVGGSDPCECHDRACWH